MSYPVISERADVQAAYERMRKEGQSHNMAEILATRQCPTLNTDTRRLIGWSEPRFSEQLARFPGDPEAWVNHPDDYRRVLKQRGWGCRGSLNIKATDIEVPDDKPYRAADDLVDREVERIVSEHQGDVTPEERRVLWEDTLTRLSGNESDPMPAGGILD